MKKSNPLKPLIGILCILLLIGAVMLALWLDSQSPDPIFGVLWPDPTDPTETTEATEATEATVPTVPTEVTQPTERPDTPEDTVTPPQDLPPVVEILPEKDPETGKPTSIEFPCQIPEYGLILDRIAPYTGMFVEDGSNSQAENVAMLLVQNNGDYPLEYTQIRVKYADAELLFDFSALPVGEALVVQEKDRKAVPAGQAEAATALVVQRANMEMSQDKVRVTDNGDNTLTIENLTGETIPTVRVFYKYFMEEEGLFVGGISFTVRVTGLGPNGKVTVQPTHYTSKTGRVVMVLTYDSEV